MALNRLTMEEMVQLTEALVTPGHRVRVAIQGIPGLGVLIPHLEDAHAALVASHETGHVQSMAEIDEALVRADRTHDELARAVYYAIEADSHLAAARGDRDTSEALRHLQLFLFPNQLGVISLSYREEAGQAKLLALRIKPEHERMLSRIPMPGGHLLDTVRAWLAAGDLLGQLEREREAKNLPGRRLHIKRARSRWIRAIRAVRTIVELTEPGDPVVEEALGRIAAAEIDAAQRA